MMYWYMGGHLLRYTGVWVGTTKMMYRCWHDETSISGSLIIFHIHMIICVIAMNSQINTTQGEKLLRVLTSSRSPRCDYCVLEPPVHKNFQVILHMDL